MRVGNLEIMALSDGKLEFDLCNFFPTIPDEPWGELLRDFQSQGVRPEEVVRLEGKRYWQGM
jgi:hypothetical protein